MKRFFEELFSAIYATIFVTAVLVLTGCNNLPKAYNAERPAAEALALKATVRVLQGTPVFAGRDSHYDYAMVCHGVAVSPTKVLTAAHCVDQCVTRDDVMSCTAGALFAVATPKQWWNHSNAQTTVISHAVIGNDIAELTLSEPVDNYVDVSSGVPAFAVFRDAVHHSPKPLQHGDSGSGMFDESGRLIAIVFKAYVGQDRPAILETL